MKTSTSCPNCKKKLTLENFEDFSSPFTMKCPHCKAKLRETKVTPFLLLVALVVIPLLIWLGITVQNFLAGFFPIVDSVPTVFVFLAFCYPVYALYERFNALVMFNKGNLHLKRQS
ncbi:hypothetical protein RRU94_19060 [Domibacillus sp. DTU_2020_1001157_1_SI_ALB_TIR_016]|uniref:hypothetical protein n=1 Tax=Domibacillus sp. DTU_2020_1001157_1_SI_ALB_TIR_016 TaxID=3077789 RepID=UPI0028EE1C59|nr:hypothetical protein [Domibacillus sp. DTU_2020_1001157_1_SI_ALB_TIR_016]WNS79622.1 hypothetical protein RRU94_19060 [Domibacillus sp. DTU_2020_1001157_1_SI_ALB_TIR_016]